MCYFSLGSEQLSFQLFYPQHISFRKNDGAQRKGLFHGSRLVSWSFQKNLFVILEWKKRCSFFFLEKPSFFYHPLVPHALKLSSLTSCCSFTPKRAIFLNIETPKPRYNQVITQAIPSMVIPLNLAKPLMNLGLVSWKWCNTDNPSKEAKNNNNWLFCWPEGFRRRARTCTNGTGGILSILAVASFGSVCQKCFLQVLLRILF